MNVLLASASHIDITIFKEVVKDKHDEYPPIRGTGALVSIPNDHTLKLTGIKWKEFM